MATILFLSPQYIVNNTTLNEQVEQNLLKSPIQVAQDKHAENYLGTRLYKKLLQDIEDDDLTGNYLTLFDDYVTPMILWWTMVEAYPYLYIKLDNGTLAIRTGDNFTPVAPDQYKILMDAARNNAQMYTDRLIKYLCNNASLFPEYSANQYPDITPKRQVYNENSMTFSSGNTAMSRNILRDLPPQRNMEVDYYYYR